MKHVLLFLAFILQNLVSAQSFEVSNIKYVGANDKRINLVILGDGYLESELDAFETHANNFVNAMFSQSPFSEYSDYFNVYIIKVISEESGATHPGTATDEPSGPGSVPVTTVNNYFGASYDSYSVHRLLYSSNYALINNTLANNFPEYDQALILVNAPYYGGSGGTYPFASTDASSIEIAIHELGHSFVGLNDEYYPGDALATEAINMTQDNNPATNKWHNWIGTNNVGIFSYGSSGTASTWFRPHQNCKMRYLGVPFCSVCKEGIIEKIHSLVSPIDSYNPNSNDLETPSFPLEFQLNLIQTIPNTLATSWTLNGEFFSNALQSINLVVGDLVDGTNTLIAMVTDTTASLRVDGHESIHAYSVTWNIENSTMGIGDIASETNTLSINMYPNPVEDILHLSIDSQVQKNFSYTLFSMDGKQLRSGQGFNTDFDVNLVGLSSGIYVIRVFQESLAIVERKIVKQ